LRVEARKSPEEAAAELMCSTAKVSRIETGGRGVQALDVKVLCRFYGVTPQVERGLLALAAETRKRGWWQDYRALDEQTQSFIGLESASDSLLQVEIVRVPGLLQTPDYIRELVAHLRPPGFWDAGSIDQIVEARLLRQRRVVDGSLQLSVVIDEAALARRIGPPALMAEQLRQLISVAEQPNVRLQVTPFSAGPHPGLDGPFQLLEFRNDSLQDTVFSEAQYGNLLLRAEEKPDIVDRYREVHRHITRAVALSTDESLAWLCRYLQRLAAADRGPVADPRQH
jgi:hypothetical protein